MKGILGRFAPLNPDTPNPNGDAPIKAVDRSTTNGADPRPLTGLTAMTVTDGDGNILDTDVADSSEVGPEAGVHGITRATDYWFERRAHSLEQRARQEGEGWAKAGLPLQDVQRTDPLDVEVVLASHARQIYRDWAERVKTKMQDAIAKGSRNFGERVGALRQKVSRLDAIVEELQSREAKIERIRDESARDTTPVQYHRFIGHTLFWPMAVLLVFVEFAANFPVFRLLLPLDSALARAAMNAADNVRDDSWWAGVQLFARGLLMNIEATVVAAVVVVALVVLAKQLGASLRALVALSAKDQPLAATTINAHRRQRYAGLTLSGLGLVAVLLFLYFSRGSIAATAQSRVAEDDQRIAQLTGKLAEANAKTNRNEIATLTTQIQDRQAVRDRHADDAAYATTVQGMNIPILALNFGLICVAAVLGFGYAKDNLSDGRGEHPDLPTLRERCAELRQEQISTLGDARAALGEATAAEGVVRHLVQSNPLASWESKSKRLNAVVAEFRAENARLRGMDPANIKAFDVPCPLSLPPIEDAPGFPMPREMTSFTDERDELADRLSQHHVHQSAPAAWAARSTAGAVA